MAKDINDLNSATVEDLEGIQGIGHDRAEDIINYRDEHGPFTDWDDVKEVPGFDEGMIRAVRDGEWGEASEADDDDDDEMGGEDDEDETESDADAEA
ncbi:MAG TPA: helix-hairpin-helix domain-containing protein [Candidatus Paceibacterota bacterium]|nr:helix-hairpin-helix domain-containing protein [Candidatus Paceibacterota bacterium]